MLMTWRWHTYLQYIHAFLTEWFSQRPHSELRRNFLAEIERLSVRIALCPYGLHTVRSMDDPLKVYSRNSSRCVVFPRTRTHTVAISVVLGSW